ncbi:MAG TPA: flagellar biosynthetic protein FliR [Gemmataceae bacterium]|nr:flagellar biosynthetic protein FliR [Gemmataceae bacterium]
MIEAAVLAFSLILARVGTFVATLPLFGGSDVPRVVKIGLTFGLSCLWFGSGLPSLDGLVASAGVGWPPYVLALAREAVLGAVLGFAFGLIFVPLRVAGEYIGQEMGLALAPLVDPTSDNPAAVVTQVFEMLGMLLFLGLDGHHAFLAGLHVTFVHWPIGGTGGLPGIPFLVRGASAAQEWGLLLAAPIGICLFATTVLLTLFARAAPQLNTFSVGMALRVVVGLVATIVLLPSMVAALVNIFSRLTDFVYRLV